MSFTVCVWVCRCVTLNFIDEILAADISYRGLLQNWTKFGVLIHGNLLYVIT